MSFAQTYPQRSEPEEISSLDLTEIEMIDMIEEGLNDKATTEADVRKVFNLMALEGLLDY